MSVNTDLSHPDNIAEPHPFYEWMRRERPVFWSDALKGWVITRYDDVYRVIRDPKFSVEKMAPFMAHMKSDGIARKVAELTRVLQDWAVFRDPPAHARLRRPMNSAFQRDRIEALRPFVHATVDRLIDVVADRGEMDMVWDFAYPLPAMVITHMMGLPETDIDTLKNWSDNLAAFVLSARATPDKYDRSHAAVMEMRDYFRAAVEDHRKSPRPDGLTDLISYGSGSDDALTDEEIVSTAILMLFAGHETTTSLITNGMYVLIKNPDQMSRLIDDPNLVPGAIEEFLRFESPAQMLVRVASEDCTIADQAIAKGDRIFASVLGANRDETKFERSNGLDVTRAKNQHLAFGHGMHLCVGAPLARLEGEIAFRRLLERLTDFELEQEAPDWSDLLVTRVIKALPVRFRTR